MREGLPGKSDQPAPRDFPPNTQLYLEKGSYQFFISSAVAQIILTTNSYHPERMHVPGEDIRQMLKDLTSAQERGQGAAAKFSMREDRERRSPDSVLFGETISWELYTSSGKKELAIKANEYHPGALYITKDDLEEILNRL